MSPTSIPRRERPPDANWAALLTWLVPGAGHLYLGRLVPAVVAFVLIEGLYYLGLQLSNGMTFEFLDPELRWNLAPVLSPEVGNLGGFAYQLRSYGFGPGIPRAWPDWIRVGGYLSALSGILNVCLMVQAHVEARASRALLAKSTAPGLLIGLAWLVPGLGHWIQGRRRRAVIVFACLVGLFVLGTVLAEASNLSRERHFYYWSGQFLVGTPVAVAEALFGNLRVAHDIPFVDAGLVFGCVAGLLNILAMIDVFGYAEARIFGWPKKASSASRPEGGEQRQGAQA